MAADDPFAVWARAATNTPNGSVHGPLPFAPGSIPTSLQALALQLGQAFRAITEAALRQVALALGAVEIFGWKPYDALVEIGDDIIDAKANFNTLLSAFGLPTMDDVADAMVDASNNALAAVNDLGGFLVSTGQASLSALGAALASLIAWLSSIPANLISGALNPVAVTLSGTPIGDLLQYINSSGQFSAAQLTGALNGAVTFGGTTLSTLLQNLNSTGQFAASQLTGALNGAVTYGGTALSTLLQYLNGSGQFNAAQLTGALNGVVTFGGTVLNTLFTNLTGTGGFQASGLTGAMNTAVTVSGTQIGTLLSNINSSGQLLAAGITGGLTSAATVGGTAITTLLQYLNGTGQFNAAQLQGALAGTVTFGGTALSTLLQYLNSSGKFNAAQLQGALANTVTYGGTALSTFFQNINSSGQLLAPGITGALGTALTVGGTTLGTLFTNINSSGNLLASGLTGALGTGLTVGGTTLSTLFTNINSSGQLLGPGITGAINTAATVGGTAIGTVATNASTGAAGIASLITNVTGAAVIADVATALNTAGSNAQGVINGIVNGINNSAVTGQSAAQAQTAVNNFISGVVNNLQGIPGTFGLTGTTSANSAFAAAAAARQAQADEITRQQSAFNAVFNVSPSTAGNVNVNVNFASYANQSGMSGIMSPGSGSGTNYMGVTSGEAAWQGGSGTPDTEVFPTQLTSDYAIVDVTLGNLKDIATQNVATHIPIRCNSLRNTFVFLAILADGGGTRLWLGCFNSGTLNVTFSSFSAPLSLSSGGLIRVYAGNPTALSEYAFQVTYNGTPVITATDSGHNSQIGAGQRYVGLRMTTTTNGQYPPQIRSITYQDNPPPPSSYPHSGRPTAGTKGRLWAPNDVGLMQRDNSTAWETIWGGVLSAFTEPPSSGWTTTTLGSATFAADKGARFLTLPSASGDNLRVEYRTPAATSNYIMAAYIESAVVPGNFHNGGLILRDSSGKMISFGINYTTTYGGWCLAAGKWNSASSFSAWYFGTTLNTQTGIAAIPNWLRIRDDGSNRYFEYSFNGVDWLLAYSVGRTDFLTPNTVGWGASNNASGNTAYLRLRSLTGV